MKIRGHHLICILGFRGLGYSPEHVLNMKRIVGRLQLPRSVHFEVVDYPDDICAFCPFFVEGGCQQNGPSSEAIVKSLDFNVMTRLGLTAEERLTWPEVEAKIRARLYPEDIDVICKECRWLPLGYCVEGLKELMNDR
jgi:hypothetical protein